MTHRNLIPGTKQQQKCRFGCTVLSAQVLIPFWPMWSFELVEIVHLGLVFTADSLPFLIKSSMSAQKGQCSSSTFCLMSAQCTFSY